VVEDDPAVQRALKRLFVAEGFAVETQSDGEGALNSFHAEDLGKRSVPTN
jgi:DNA-binding response OmpR family regulator